MSEEDQRQEGSEDKFFTAKPREDSFVGKVGPPPPVGPKIAAGVAAAVVLIGLAYWQLRTPANGVMWVMNPGPEPAMVAIDDGPAELAPPGRVSDRQAKVGAPLTLHVDRDGILEKITAEVAPESEAVTIVDLIGDAAYVVLDVSSHYGDTPGPAKLPVSHISPPAMVHRIPVPALKLVRPAQPIPNPGSWELQAFKAPSRPLEIHKAFRIDAKRLEDKEKLIEQLSEAVKSGHAVDFENARYVDTSTDTVDGVIPNSEDR
jgi:hypothetical protein